MYRVEWIKHQEREKKKLEDEKEKERGWLLIFKIENETKGKMETTFTLKMEE